MFGRASPAGPERLFIGLHAGSADGVEAALVEVRGRGEQVTFRQLHCCHKPFDAALRERLLALPAEVDSSLEELSELEMHLARAMSEAAGALSDRARASKKGVAAVGMLGIRLGGGLELPSPSAVARGTKLPVVGRFDVADRTAGGNGGAVTAWPAWRLLRDRRLSRVLVQLDAVASITFVGSAAAKSEVVAYDVGPGTILFDDVSRKLLNRPPNEGAMLAARGRANEAMLNELLSGRYFQRKWPKTTLARDWTGQFVDRVKLMAARHACEGAYLATTVAELTVRLVANAIAALTERPHEVVLTGAGTANAHFVKRIRSIMSPCSTYLADRYGVSVRGAQAVFAAVLAAAKLDDFPAHCRGASGAARRVVLGNVTRV